MTDGVAVLGVRHHGPGSARSVVRALEQLQPDIVLLEGPPDAQDVLALAAAEEMRPPVALVVYPPERPALAAFYPFATFSPEWNALRYALRRGVTVRFCDLPQAVMLAERANGTPSPDELKDEPGDPVALLAQAAGEADAERWWERLVEQRADDADVFRALTEAMAAVREHLPDPPPREARREGHMRQEIRRARDEGHRQIAVVCGAWHAPALDSLPPARHDAQLLRGLKRMKVEATWVPWTASRLAYESGYGAGVESPAWYRHLWETNGDLTAWLAAAARLLRAEDLDASPAQVVEAVRLAEALSAMRGQPQPSLTEVSEAVLAVLCGGESARLQLIRRKLIVGEEMGALPEGVPSVPLQRDLNAQARRLRLKFEAEDRTLDLDLRQPAHMEQSQFFHRLRLLRIDWAHVQPLPSGKLGTFHELWKLSWAPELALQVVEAGVYGNTVADAAAARAVERGQQTPDLGELAALLEVVLLAGLEGAVPALTRLLAARSAESTDTLQMLTALPPLASTLRYGDVRRTDTSSLAVVARAVAERAMVGLGAASAGVDDDAARALADGIVAASRAVGLLQDQQVVDDWWTTVGRLVDQPDLHGFLAGTGCRLLVRAEKLSHDDAASRLGWALARGAQPAAAAQWLEGFLGGGGGGLELATSARLFGMVDTWLVDLSAEHFAQVVPLLRRATSEFSSAERRHIAERVRAGASGLSASAAAEDDLDAERAALVEPVVLRILGIER